MKFFTLLTLVALSCFGCKEDSAIGGQDTAIAPLACKGIYFDRNKYGALRKWNEHPNNVGTACLLDQVSLSTWEQSAESRRGQNISCASQVLDTSLKASGNYYQYRDGREYLDLDGSTGQYRRLFFGELKNGREAFTREYGCFWVRDGTGVDAAFGRQLLLDTTSVAATEPFIPAEIYRVDQTGSNFLLTRFDDSADWGYKFCPELRTPWDYCLELRNGNLMYYPDLSAAIQTSLTNEAKLIRTQFTFSAISRSEFDLLWTSLPGSKIESVSSNWKYSVQQVVDTPRYTDGAWRDYVKGDRPTMPDVGSSNEPPTCYRARKAVTLADGTTSFISGQVCYLNGEYEFQQ